MGNNQGKAIIALKDGTGRYFYPDEAQLIENPLAPRDTNNEVVQELYRTADKHWVLSTDDSFGQIKKYEVSHAHLYVRHRANGSFERSQVWNTLSDVTTRSTVLQNRRRWELLATEIFNYLNDLFDRGELEGRPFVEAYSSGGVTSLILENASEVKDAIVSSMRLNSVFRSNVIVWWNNYRAEYGGNDREQVLAMSKLTRGAIA